MTTVNGSLSGQQPSTAYVLQFFANDVADPSGAGEGQTLLGTQMVTTDGSGNVTFSFAFATADTTGKFLSATATDPLGNTSTFAPDVTIAASASPAANKALAGANTLARSLVDLNPSNRVTPATVSLDVLDSILSDLVLEQTHVKRRVGVRVL
jgi:hypothetical protein